MNQLFCPAAVLVAAFVAASFVAWVLCRIAALSDKAIEAMKEEAND